MDVPTDPDLRVGIADYSWLPAEYHPVFQATLEKDDGIAAIHFIAEIERCTGEKDPSARATPAASSGQKLPYANLSISRRIIVVSHLAVYLCNTSSEISRCLKLERIEEIFTMDDWICLSVPKEYDLLFRVTPRNLNRNCHQSYFLDTLTALRYTQRLPILRPKPIQSMEALVRRRLVRPSLTVTSGSGGGQGLPRNSQYPHLSFASNESYREDKPLVIPVYKWEDLARFPYIEALVRTLLPAHAEYCGRLLMQQHGASDRFGGGRPSSPEAAKETGNRPDRYLHLQTEQTQTSPRASSPLLKRKQATAKSTGFSPDSADRRREDGAGSPGRNRTQVTASSAGTRFGSMTGKPAGGGKASPPRAQRPSPPRQPFAYPDVDAEVSDERRKELGLQSRFEDPCLEMIWQELMDQRKAIENIQAKLTLVLEDRYPYAGSATVTSPSGREQRPADPARRSTKVNIVRSGDPRHVDVMGAPLEELTPFQRGLISKFLYEEPIKPEYANAAATKSMHPSDATATGAGTGIVRRAAAPHLADPDRQGMTPTRLVQSGPTTGAAGRRPVVSDYLDEPHYQTKTKSMRAHEQRTLTKQSTPGGGGPLEDVTSPKWKR